MMPSVQLIGAEPIDQLATIQNGSALPALIANYSDQVRRRFVEFFAAEIRNPNTRSAYARAIGNFCTWCDVLELKLEALRALFDYRVVYQVIPFDPAQAVWMDWTCPKVSAKKGENPTRVLDLIRISS